MYNGLCGGGMGNIFMRSVELFSGCGGLALGLARAGFHHDLMVEWNDNAAETVHYNRELGLEHIRAWTLEKADVRDVTWLRFAGTDLVAGSPPCQPFSIGGKHRGHGDIRDMWPEAIRAVREIRPRGFLFENVKGLARPTFSRYLRWIVAHLRHPEMTRANGEDHETHTQRLETTGLPTAYRVIVAHVNAADYGAAQKRHRVIIAGIRADITDRMEPPQPTHTRERLLWDQWVTDDYWQRHALRRPSDDMIFSKDQTIVATLRARRAPPEGEAWVTVRDAIAGLGDPNEENNHVFQAGARVYPGHTGSPLDQPAKALKAGDHGVPGGENMMVQDNGAARYFTVREAARLQGLPDTYQFPGSWTESMRQLGNAVPVPLAEAMGQWMIDMLETAATRHSAAA